MLRIPRHKWENDSVTRTRDVVTLTEAREGQ